MNFIEELKRRNVIRVGIAYGVFGWLVIQVAETLFPIYGLSDQAIKLVVSLVALGLLPALLFAWIFEATPEGIKREKDVDRSASITTSTGRQLDRVIIAVLAVALGYFIVDKFFLAAPDPSPRLAEGATSAQGDAAQGNAEDARQSVAVLPFTNMSNDPANEPFTLGIHDDLLTQLSRIGSLKVTSRTSMLQYRDTTKPIPEIARELGVDHILEGGIQRAGNRVRINMQLIDARTDEHLWAEIYDRELTAENLFSVQGEIAGEVTRSLQATLSPAEQAAMSARPTQSMAAYDLYLLGRHHQETRSESSLLRAIGYFEQAIAEDPDYVLALTALAESQILMASYQWAQGAEVYPIARTMLDRALQLDDTLAEVWAADGLYWYMTEDNTESLASFERAIELDPQNFHAWLWYANALANQRRFVDQLEAMKTAYSIEPMSQPVNNNLAFAYRNRGDWVRARQHFERVDRVDPEDTSEWRQRVATTYVESGELARGIAEGRQVLAEDPANYNMMEALSDAYRFLGDGEAARRWAEEAEKVNAGTLASYWTYLARDEFDGAIAYIDDKDALVDSGADTWMLFLRFQASYLGGRIEAARSYLNEYLGHLGGRREVNPDNFTHTNNLLVAHFLLTHGDQSPGGAARGEEMVRQVEAALNAFREQDFDHPLSAYGLALVYASQGKKAEALAALEHAINRGFRQGDRLRLEPALASLRSEAGFEAIQARLNQAQRTERDALAGMTLAAFQPMARKERIILPREILERYTGHYTDGNALVHVFVDEQGQLFGQPATLPPLEFHATSETTFYIDLTAADEIEFIMGESGVADGVELRGGGGSERFFRTEAPPEPVSLSPQQLAAFEGTFATERISDATDGAAESDIWIAIIRVEPDGSCSIDFDDQPKHPCAPIAENAFRIPGFLGTFEYTRSDATLPFDRLVRSVNGREQVFTRR